MAKVKMITNEAYVFAEVSIDDIRKVSKFKPDALTIKDEKGESVFAVGAAPLGAVNKYGVSFTNEDAGKAYFKVAIFSEDPEERKTVFSEEYAAILKNLSIVETQIKTALIEIERDIEEFKSQIETL